MKVILVKDVENLGYAEEVVSVKPGYARNYLIPRGLAVVNNAQNQIELKESIKRREKVEAKQLEALRKVMDQLKETKLSIGAKVGSNNKIFGSIQPIHISEQLKEKGIEIDRRKISFKEGDIKEIGNYTVVISLTKEETLELPLEIYAD